MFDRFSLTNVALVHLWNPTKLFDCLKENLQLIIISLQKVSSCPCWEWSLYVSIHFISTVYFIEEHAQWGSGQNNTIEEIISFHIWCLHHQNVIVLLSVFRINVSYNFMIWDTKFLVIDEILNISKYSSIQLRRRFLKAFL